MKYYVRSPRLSGYEIQQLENQIFSAVISKWRFECANEQKTIQNWKYIIRNSSNQNQKNNYTQKLKNFKFIYCNKLNRLE